MKVHIMHVLDKIAKVGVWSFIGAGLGLNNYRII